MPRSKTPRTEATSPSTPEKRITIAFNEGDRRRLERAAANMDASQNEVIRRGIRLIESLGRVLEDEDIRLIARSKDGKETELLISL